MDDRHIDDRVSPQLALRALVHSLRFDGRSTQSEVVSFWLFGILANLLVHLSAPVLDLIMPSALYRGFDLIWSFVLGWPYFPLLVRRLHDQDRSGGWVMLWGLIVIACTMLLMLPKEADGYGLSISLFGFHRSLAWTPVTTPLLLGLMMVSIAILILYVLPGTLGTNRYGPDPRVEPELPQSTIPL
ncbi:MAG: DUF805 domain-containing protein [Pseudomonadota bacterium]|jgi:uncharacterized membrane protein YhaH (DUF805 family)|uniref:DUF805 domain-containing protein n=1 Tax=hydrothermal vent metagenome TaxID=652676 RepID=A0A160TGI0_9ZZZZ